MALKILSGMVFVPHGGIAAGNVVISFDPFELSEASNNEIELRKVRQIGPDGRYNRRPASMVAARQFSLLFPFPHAELYRVRLNDTVTRDFLTIDWTVKRDDGRVDQEEIPFIVIGEVPDPRNRVKKGRAEVASRRRRARGRK